MQLQSADVWILLSLQGNDFTKDLDIAEVIAKADCINHAILTFEEFNNAICRLKENELIEVYGKKVRITPFAEQLIKAKSKCSILKTWELLEVELNAAPYSFQNKLIDIELADLFVSKSEFEIQVEKYIGKSRAIIDKLLSKKAD